MKSRRLSSQEIFGDYAKLELQSLYPAHEMEHLERQVELDHSVKASIREGCKVELGWICGKLSLISFFAYISSRTLRLMPLKSNQPLDRFHEGPQIQLARLVTGIKLGITLLATSLTGTNVASAPLCTTSIQSCPIFEF